MIVVVGSPAWQPSEPAGPAGMACSIAIAAARGGAAVELVGRAGDDPAGDSLMIALARAGVGHVALLRDPARPTPIVEAPVVVDIEDPSLLDDDVATSTLVDRQAAWPRLEPADVDLGLRYLTEYTVLVLAPEVPRGALPVAIDAAEFAGAHLVVLLEEGSDAPAGVPAAATVLVAPDSDPDGDFAALVGVYAAALDAGSDPSAAFAAARGPAWQRPVA